MNPAGSYTKPDPRDFTWADNNEPHASRREEILKKYPQIKDLFVPEPLTFVVVTGILLLQLAMVVFVQDVSWPVLLVCAYVVGGVCNHSLQLAAHELSHNLCWSNVIANKFTAIYCNFATGFPSSITFQRYHMEHHSSQGVDTMDADIPSSWEVSYFNNTVLKICWLIAQPIWYAFRPLFIKPKPFIFWEGVNWVFQVAFDVAIIYCFGLKSMTYLWLATLLGLGLHPSAGHFIAEHYEIKKGQETYSYYGPWNLTNFNVGYHNEHHDFPRVPWTKLPEVKRIAKEYYDLPCYDSYISVMMKYIFDESVGPWSRIKRKMPEATQKYNDRKALQEKTLSENVFKYIAAGAMGSVIMTGIYLSFDGIFVQ